MQGTIKDGSSRTAGSEVESICEKLSAKIGRQKYRIWFDSNTRFDLKGQCLTVCAPNLFIANWLENHFLADITKAAQSVLGSSLKISFSIDPKLSGTRINNKLSCQTDLSQNNLLHQKSQQAQTGTTSRKLRLTLDTFVVGPSNELAYNAAKAVIKEHQSPFNPLFIHGGYGIGKTHLLQGICNGILQQRQNVTWLYISAEDFANQFVLALKTKKLETFRKKIRRIDVLAIDDIHFLSNKPSIQEEFFHTFNMISLAGKQVVLASDAHPKQINRLSEKLVNRFVSGMVVKIEPPTLQTRCEICRRYADRMMQTAFTDKNFSLKKSRIPDVVIQYIAEKLRSNVRELEGAILKLVAYAALQNEKVTLGMAQMVLADHIERCDPIVHVSDIETATADFFNVTNSDIRSAKKDRTSTLARHFCMYLLRKHSHMSSAEIGRFLGNKNHATVLMGTKRIEDLVNRRAQIRWQGPNGNKVENAHIVLENIENNMSR